MGFIDAGGSFHPFSLGISNQTGIFDILEDPQGNIWFATMGKGLFRLSPDGSIKQWKNKMVPTTTRKRIAFLMITS